MNDASSLLNHTRWECKYHIIWIPKYRKKTLFGQLRQYLGQVFQNLARSREGELIERAPVAGPCAHAHIKKYEQRNKSTPIPHMMILPACCLQRHLNPMTISHRISIMVAVAAKIITVRSIFKPERNSSLFSIAGTRK